MFCHMKMFTRWVIDWCRWPYFLFVFQLSDFRMEVTWWMAVVALAGPGISLQEGRPSPTGNVRGWAALGSVSGPRVRSIKPLMYRWLYKYEVQEFDFLHCRNFFGFDFNSVISEVYWNINFSIFFFHDKH